MNSQCTSPWIENYCTSFLVDATTALGDIFTQTKKLILILSSTAHKAFKKDKYLLFEVNLRSIVLHTEKYIELGEKKKIAAT